MIGGFAHGHRHEYVLGRYQNNPEVWPTNYEAAEPLLENGDAVNLQA
jgi:hypothetical protein